MRAQADVYYTKPAATTNFNLLTNWSSTLDGTGPSPANLDGHDLVVTNNRAVTTAASSIAQPNSLTIESGSTVTIGNNGRISLPISGTLTVRGILVWNVSNAGFTPQGTIFNGTESFDATSTLRIQNWRTNYFLTGISNLGTLDIRTGPATGAWNLGLNNGTILQGNLVCNFNQVGAVGLTSGATRAITVNGNLTLTNGLLQFGDATPLADYTLNVFGDFTMGVNGEFNANVASGRTFLLHLRGANNLLSLNSAFSTTGVNYTVAAGATYTLTDQTITVAAGQLFTLNGSLTANNTVLTGAGQFSTGAAAILATDHPAGVAGVGPAGTIQLTGGQNYAATCTYIFTNTSTQNTGFSTHPLNAGRVEVGRVRVTGRALLDADLSVSDSVSVVNAATLELGMSTIARNVTGLVSVQGVITTTHPAGFSGGVSTALQNYTAAQILFGASSTLGYNGAAQTVTAHKQAPNLLLSGTGTKTADGSFTVSGTLTLNNVTFNGSTATVTLQGPTAGTGTVVNAAGGTIALTGSVTGTWPYATSLDGAFTYNRASRVLTLAGSLTVVENFNLVNGTVAIASGTLTTQGAITGTGTITGTAASTWNLLGLGIISAINTPVTLGTFNFDPATSKTLTLTGNLTLTNSLHLGANAVLSASGRTITLNSAFTAVSGATINDNNSTTYLFNGSAAQSWPAAINAVSGRLTLNNSAGVQLNGALTLGNLTLTNGTLDLNDQHLTLNEGYTRTNGLLAGSSGSRLTINGTGNVNSPIVFDETAGRNTLEQLTINRPPSGTVTLGSNLNISGPSNAVVIFGGVLNASTYSIGGPAANLVMTSGANIRLGKLGSPLPEFGGSYSLASGSTITVDGAGDQTIKGGMSYRNLMLSGSGTKTFTDSINGSNVIAGTFSVQGTATVDLQDYVVGGRYTDGTITNLTMGAGTRLRSSNTTFPVPAMAGTYTNNASSTLELYGTDDVTQQNLRGGRSFGNIEINADAANRSLDLNRCGNVLVGPGNVGVSGTLSLNTPAVMAIETGSAITGTGTFAMADNTGLIYADNNGIALTGATGAVRTTTRNFSSNAWYGVRGGTNMVTGTGLPAVILGFILGKSGGTVTFSNPTTVQDELYLLGGNLTAASLTLANDALITRTEGVLTNAPTTGANLDLYYAPNDAAITVGNEWPSLSGVIRNVTTENTLDVTLTANRSVKGVLAMVEGYLTVNPANTLTLEAGALLSGEKATSYVRGPIQTQEAVGAGSSTFKNLGFAVSGGAEDLGTITLTRRAGPGYAQSGLGNTGISRFFTANITGAQPTSGRIITLRWTTDEDNGKDFSTYQGAVFTRPNGLAPWERLRLGGPWYPTYLSGTMRTIYAQTFHFSDFTVTDETSPLPVQLLSFSGASSAKGHALTWSTAQEINNAGFTLQKSRNGVEFTELGFVTGRGTTQSSSAYEYLDLGEHTEVYYRLVQHDLDGKTTTIGTIQVGGAQKEHTPSLYPNPSQGQVTLNLNGFSSQAVRVLNALGQVVLEKTTSIHEPVVELDLTALPAGLYRVVASGSQGQHTTSVLKQ